ncbi:MAG: hypothetical protein GXO19_03405 [Epsilonproteobacteria bacterium]|nr:hypothetical protein [Campylobacterota bacterium]NPA56765.1 hypothetical protein [Campylobacterota bacterium]
MGSLLPFILLLLIGTAGYGKKICGIDERAFWSFNSHQREEICKIYLQERKGRKGSCSGRKELSHLFKGSSGRSPREVPLLPGMREAEVEIVAGWIRDRREKRGIAPLSFTLIDGEVRKVCFDSYCFWVARRGNTLFINVRPDPRKVGTGGYMGRFFLSRETERVVATDRGRRKEVHFRKGRVEYHLRLIARYR